MVLVASDLRPKGESETSQLELSLKSHAFQKFTEVIDTH